MLMAGAETLLCMALKSDPRNNGHYCSLRWPPALSDPILPQPWNPGPLSLGLLMLGRWGTVLLPSPGSGSTKCWASWGPAFVFFRPNLF